MANQTTPVIQIKDTNVGIGTTTPAVRLSGRVLSINDTSGAVQSSIELLRNGNSSGEIFVNSDNMVVGSFETGIPLTFRTQNNEHLRITSGGNVLIGTTTDAGYKLDVNGSFRTGANGMALNSSGFATTPNANTPWNAFRFSHPQNIIPNGDLESWTSGTSTAPDGYGGYDLGASTVITRESSVVKQGTYSAKILNPSGAAFSGMVYSLARVDKTPSSSATSEYTISFWHYAPTSNGSVSYIGIYSDTAAGYVVIQQLPTSSGWTFYSRTFSIRDDSNFEFYWWTSWGGGTANDVLYIDSVVLNKGTQLYDVTQSSVSRTGNATRWGDFYNLGGNVGIGTASPGTPLGGALGLVIDGNANGDVQFRLQANSTGRTSTDGGLLSISGTAMYLWNYENDATLFGTNNAERMRITAGGNVLIGTTTDAGYKVNLVGDLNITGAIRLAGGGATVTFISEGWGINLNGSATQPTQVRGSSFSVGYVLGGGTNYGTGNMFVSGNVGIGTTNPNRSLQVVGTTRHERVYAYANNVFQFANDVSQNELWLHLGTQSAFTTDKIYYRVNTNTSEEEGEIIVKNTCATANIEWLRNSYNVMVTAVKARMQGSCGACEIFIRVRYGSNYGGANTTVQWQVHNGTDAGFTTVNAVATPGTGTSEANIASTDGYMVSTSNNQSIGGNLGVGTTSPSYRAQIETTTGTLASWDNGDGAIWSTLTSAKSIGLSSGTNYAGSSDFTWMKLTGGSSGNMIFTVNNEVMRMLRNGNVLIGTTTDAGYKLDVNGSGRFLGLLQVNGPDSVARADSHGISFYNANVDYRISFDSQSGTKGFIRYNVDTAGSTLHGHIFSAGDFSGGSVTDLMLVRADGSVGIGTTSPLARLHVRTSTNEGTIAVGNEIYPGLLYANAGSGEFRIDNRGSFASGYITFFPNGQNTTAGSEAMRIATSRNVLIGTTTDGGYKLDVNGNTNVSGGSITAGSETTYAFRVLQGKPLTLGGDSNYAYIQSWSSGPLVLNGQGNNVLLSNETTYLGIGSASPNVKLRVQSSGSSFTSPDNNNVAAVSIYNSNNSSTNAHAVLSLRTQISGGNPFISFDVENETGWSLGMENSTNQFRLAQGWNSLTSTPVISVPTSGNVLIGTTTDGGYKLRVNGEILADDDIRIFNTYALILNGTDANWRIGRNTITDTGWLTGNTMQMVVFGGQTGQGFQVVNSNGTALFEIDGVAGASRFSNALGVGVNPSGTSGRIDASNDIVAYSTSDSRLKENITPIANALDKVKSLTGVEFDWKEETKDIHGYEGHDVGVIAQEVQAVLPEAIRTNDTGYLSVRYEKMIALLIEANKELAARVEELEKKLK
jgi:hypothetical protein